jgi:hypothetical protein
VRLPLFLLFLLVGAGAGQHQSSMLVLAEAEGQVQLCTGLSQPAIPFLLAQVVRPVTLVEFLDTLPSTLREAGLEEA